MNSYPEHAQKIDLYLERVTPFGFSGALLIATRTDRGGWEALLNTGYGMADRRQGIPNTAQTVFNLGSITKQFTAAGILKLEMMGALSTRDPLSRHLPGVPAGKAGITLHHLLTHTSGLQETGRDDFEMVARETMLAEILDPPLKFAPGERYEYSNAGYTVLAAVIEHVSGQQYEAFLHEHLFAPAGMESTGYRLPDWSGKSGNPVARWYKAGVDQGISLEKAYPSWSVIGNGEMLSTTGDMLLWHQALSGETLLSGSALRKLYTPFLKNYAYGWEVQETPHGRLVHHGGASLYGSSAEFDRYLDLGLVMILFCNQDYGGALSLAKLVRPKITALVFGGEVGVPQPVFPVPEAELRPFAGLYRLPDSGDELSAWVDDGALRIAGSGQQALNVLAFPDQEDPRPYQELNRRTQAIFEAAIAGDFSLLEAVARDSEARLPVLKRIIGEQAGAVGAQGAHVSGTLPSSLIEGALDTFVILTGPQGEAPFIFLWQDGKNIGLAQLPFDPRQIASMPFHPVSKQELLKQEFLGYHLGAGQVVRIRFDLSPEGRPEGLAALGKKGEVFFSGVRPC